MFAAMLFAFSIVALAQFALYYWRAVLSGVARQPLSATVLEAVRVEEGQISGADFGALASLHNLTADLRPGIGGLGLVRIYYRLIDGLHRIAGARAPELAQWAEHELAICARYAAVQIDRRLQANLALAAALRSC